MILITSIEVSSCLAKEKQFRSEVSRNSKDDEIFPDNGKTGESLRRKTTGPNDPNGVNGSQLPKEVTYRQDTAKG